jgi:hypothetical protein
MFSEIDKKIPNEQVLIQPSKTQSYRKYLSDNIRKPLDPKIADKCRATNWWPNRKNNE